MNKRKKGPFFLTILWSLLLPVIGNLYLQLCQNNLDFLTAFRFAFSWHTSKFMLGCLILWMFLVLIWSILGKLRYSSLLFSVIIGLVGLTTYQKMQLRNEPLYPDDLKMLFQWQMLRDIVGTPFFIMVILIVLLTLVVASWSIYYSFKFSKKNQIIRISGFILSASFLVYCSDFNNQSNVIRKAYNRTATWVPYSQEMNYYNVGFIGGFLYNLNVEALSEPPGYSKETIQQIVAKYNALATEKNHYATDEQPNIIYVMSESFSDPSRLIGVNVDGQPLYSYQQIANKSFSGQMLSQNYGGGTANIEFEALTSFSMALLNSQMTTPYTMLVPKRSNMPSIVSFLKNQDYQTTAIHPYDTSMYKRTDVYKVFGFDKFLDQDDIENPTKIENNPYISDEAVYKQIVKQLKTSDQAQFIHFVTMQTHMPYGNKYNHETYTISGTGNHLAAADYVQDIAYSSQALSSFIKELATVERPSVVVFWGDHLPSFYSQGVKDKNSDVSMHLTEYLLYSTAENWSEKGTFTISPYYFSAILLEKAKLKTSGFYELMNQMAEFLPASEKERSYYQGKWQQEVRLSKKEQKTYNDYRLIQYDLLQGEQYSLHSFFQVVP